MEQTPLPTGSLDVATLRNLKVCLEDTGHPTPDGVYEYRHVPLASPSHSHEANWPVSQQKSVAGEETVMSRALTAGDPSNHRARATRGVAQHLQSSVHLELQ